MNYKGKYMQHKDCLLYTSVYDLARSGYDVVQIAQQMGSDINLMLIKLQEMNKMGYDFNIPYDPDSRFFRKIHI